MVNKWSDHENVWSFGYIVVLIEGKAVVYILEIMWFSTLMSLYELAPAHQCLY